MNSAFTGMESCEIFWNGIFFGLLACLALSLICVGIAIFVQWYQSFKEDVRSYNAMQALRFNVNEEGKVCVVEVKKSSNRRFTKSNRS